MKKVRIATTATTAILFFFILTSATMAQQDGKKVLLEKKIEIKSDARLIVDHEFGKVICTNWEQDAIAIKVTAKWKSGSDSHVQKIIDKVILDVHGDRNQVVAICKPGHKHGNGNNSFSLIMEIQAPVSIGLELEQKFGFALVETINGPADISSEYGSVQLGSLNNNQNKVDVEFGNGSADHITSGELNISYSEFELKTAGSIELNSEFSNTTITQKVKSLTAEVEGGNLTIDKIGDLNLDAQYTNIAIHALSNSLSMETEYGSVAVNYIAPDFESISIENEFGSVDLKIDQGASYRLSAESEFGDIQYPEENAHFSYKKRTAMEFECEGIIGGGDPKSVVSIESHYGSVRISN